jgi:Na+-translocating ferredoxin:NAD+ oxidoreductase RnfD subunit/NAD-dependent dihydropyrimidine dehydrogenase PreA subunit
MTYTFISLVIITAVTVILWWPVTYKGWSLGLTLAIACAIAVVVAVALDYLLSLIMKEKGPLNTMSAAVFGLIVALSYSLGVPAMVWVEVLAIAAPDAFIYIAIISALGIVVFKKLQGLLGRKYVNPAAAAKLLVLLPFLYQILLPKDHLSYIPTLAAHLGYEGDASFATMLQACYGNPILVWEGAYVLPPPPSDLFWTMFIAKYHGWPGGASSLAVIIVGVAFFVVARRYVKWRITLSYLAMTVVMSLIMTAAYGGDSLLRMLFHLFIGSSIFLAFFMATDPATTPLTNSGQYIFGVGLGVLTVLIQTYMNFLGGSILALVIMNLTSPMLDKVGLLKPTEEKLEKKRPKPQLFETIKTTSCIRCGACMTACCHNLSPALIMEAFEKGDTETLKKLQADLCDGCGNCSFICPARIDLRAFALRAKASLRTAK